MENTPSTLIARIRQRLFGVEPAPAGQVATMVDEDVPRYPPFMKGLPAAPVERILSSQTELITSIEQALAMPDSLYQTIAAPVIHRYAPTATCCRRPNRIIIAAPVACFGMDWKSPIGQPRHPKAVCLPRQHHPRNEKHKNYVASGGLFCRAVT